MSFRGPAIQYKIRKTTINNRTGDNFSITIPRILAEQFQECLFRIETSGTQIIFTSGCKLTVSDLETQNNSKKIILGGGMVQFK